MAAPKKHHKIYSLSHPLLATECVSILGDKYRHALSFDFSTTENLAEATIIAWDGVVSVKMRRLLPFIKASLKDKVLFIMGEAQTLFADHPMVNIFQSNDIETFQLTGWSVLPEEILDALEQCHQKSTHV